MFPQQPQIPRLGDRLLRSWRDVVGVGFADGFMAGEQGGDIEILKTEERQIKAQAVEVGECEAQQLIIPAGELGEFIVGVDVGAELGVGEGGDLQSGDGGQAHLDGGLDPAMAGDDAAVGIDQHRVDKAELADTGDDLLHLLGGVGARVAGVGGEG